MLFLYDLPNWQMACVIVGACMVAVLGTYLLIRPRVRGEFSESQISAAMAFVGVMATMTSLLLAFSAVSVWESFSAAEASVVEEANVAAELARDLAVYGPPAVATRTALYKYLNLVVDEEWPLLATGQASLNAWQQLDEIFREAGKIEPQSARDSALIGEVWGRVNELAKARRERIHASQAEVPGMLWGVVLTATALTFLLTFIFPVTRFSVGLLASLSATMGLVFFFIVAMDRPFAGKESVDSSPIQSTLANMKRWDATEKGK